MTMMAPLSDWISALSDSFSATGDFDLIPFSEPIEVVRWGFIASVAAVTGGSAVLSLNKRITAGNDTGRELAAGGTITLASVDDASMTAGLGVWATPPSQLIVKPGEQLQVSVSDAGSSGTIYYFLHFHRLPFQKPGRRLAFDGSQMALLSPAGLPERDFLINMTGV